MAEQTLLPCPFCGNQPEVTEPSPAGRQLLVFVRCTAEPCNVNPAAVGDAAVTMWDGHNVHQVQTTKDAGDRARERAIIAWNTRATNVEPKE